jgi:hypothetical protein
MRIQTANNALRDRVLCAPCLFAVHFIVDWLHSTLHTLWQATGRTHFTDTKHMHSSLEEHQVVCLSCFTCEGHFLTVPSMSADGWLPLSDSLVCVMPFQVSCQAMPVCTCHIMSTWLLSFCQQGATKQVSLVSVLPCSCMSVCLARCLWHGCGGLHSHCHTAMGASSANSQ